MLRNQFKIFLRNLLKDLQFSILNLLGLSTGLACSLLIWLWVTEELKVDKFYANDSRIYQVIKNSPNADGTIYTHESTPGLLAQSIAKELPEVECAVSVRPEDPGIVTAGEKSIKANGQFASQDFFRIFSLKILEGNKEKPLADKFGLLISSELARKLFNSTSGIVGRTLQWNYGGEFDGPYKIVGIYESPPADASDHFDFILTYELFATKEAEDMAFWGSNGEYTYLLMKPGTDIDRFNSKIKDFTREKIAKLYKDPEMLKWEGSIFVQRYSEKYLHNHYVDGAIVGGRIENVRLFSIIAIFILVIACINFMNLSTAKASSRLKEIGIKKVVGASRGSLIFQYLGESMFMAFLSLIVAILIASLLLPPFRELTGKQLGLSLSPGLILSGISITFLTGLFAGSYPAIYLSGFRPALVLKGKLMGAKGESWIRKGLVVFQFSISVLLIVSVLVIYRQMKLIQQKNLGYNKDNIISFSNDGGLKKNLSAFLADIRNIPGVIHVSTMNGNFLGQSSHGGSGINWEGKNPKLGIEYYGNDVDYDFIETMGMQMAQGRAFSRNFADSAGVIFNESAIAAMGIKDPIGKKVSLWSDKRVIVGVVKDYHFQSLYKKISPAFMTLHQNNDQSIVKIKAGTERQTLGAIESIFRKFNPGLNFEYKFLDENYQALYASEQTVSTLSKYFAGLAIIISCLGLFGLAAFTAQKRQKELGIRKIVGASTANLAFLLSKNFLGLVSISMLIAFPIAWWALSEWLKNFAYRVHIGYSVFLFVAASILLITLLTVSFQSIRAAMVNPVKILRTE